jgi:hypothetical protein
MNALLEKDYQSLLQSKQHVIEFRDCNGEDFQMILSDTQELLSRQ